MHERAGTQATKEDLIDSEALINAYYKVVPDPTIPEQRVAFGTSGHRGSALNAAFNEAHIAAIAQATAEFRITEGISGPLFIGADTHALSRPALTTAIEVLVGNGVTVRVDKYDDFVPTPALSHAIVRHNRTHSDNLADGIITTPSHNPPSDGGIKYNPPHGGPAPAETSEWIASRANEILTDGNRGIKRGDASAIETYDFRSHYVDDLSQVLDMDAIRKAGLRIGVHPLGGASTHYWPAIAERYGISITVVNSTIDSHWEFMPLDWDGKIRTDPSSPSVMTFVVKDKDEFDIVIATDADADRHGIVTPEGLMNPNHFLATAVDYLFTHRPGWSPTAAVGKTVVSSRIIDRVAASLGRTLCEVPVGFKWFVPGLSSGSVAFCGEESAGASFLRTDGSMWTSDKDGLLLGLLACEMQAVTGKSPSAHYRGLAKRLGDPAYERVDAPANDAQKTALKTVTKHSITATHLAGDPITAVQTTAEGNGEPIGGIRVCTDNAWFAARPSGTENIYKIYAESFRGVMHLRQVHAEARSIVDAAITPTQTV